MDFGSWRHRKASTAAQSPSPPAQVGEATQGRPPRMALGVALQSPPGGATHGGKIDFVDPPTGFGAGKCLGTPPCAGFCPSATSINIRCRRSIQLGVSWPADCSGRRVHQHQDPDHGIAVRALRPRRLIDSLPGMAVWGQPAVFSTPRIRSGLPVAASAGEELGILLV